MNEQQETILSKLMHSSGMRFNELWDKDGPSNKFAYHLQALEVAGFVKKTDELYSLTHEGRKYVTYVEGSSGKMQKFPWVGVAVVVLDEKNQKVLLQQRLKEPFYGYWGVVGGKLDFDKYILECAAQELFEETGLSANLDLAGIVSTKTLNNEVLSYHHEFFIIRATNPSGELVEVMREGKNEWVSFDEVESRKNLFPNIKYFLKIARSQKFCWLEADRFQKDEAFVGITIRKDIVF